MAIDSFIRFKTSDTIDKIPGESQDSQLKGSDGWSSIKSVEFSATHAATIETGKAGAAHAKLTFEEFSVSKIVDAASPGLFMTLCAGDTFKEVEIVCRKALGGAKAGGAEDAYLSYTFQTVFVTNVAVSVSDGDDAPSETVKFSYGGLQMRYRQQEANGKLASPKYATWSLVHNTSEMQGLSNTGAKSFK